MTNIIEIERKFLINKDIWTSQGEKSIIRQGYLATNDKLVCRVRQKENLFYLSVKADITGITRHDFEYEIPPFDGRILLTQHCNLPLVEKIRHKVWHKGMLWEVDVFTGSNQGLIVAEIELKAEDQNFEKPDWLGSEVSDDPRYLNANLYKHPYKGW